MDEPLCPLNPVLTPGDLIGYPMRAWQILSSRLFFEALGADTVFMPFPDVIPSLQTGLIKGSEMAPMTYSVIGLVDHAPHFVLTRHSYNTGMAVANKRWLDSLPHDIRSALLAAVPDKSVVREMFRANTQRYFASMRAQGAQVHELTEVQRAQWRAASRPVHPQLLQALGKRAGEIDQVIQTGKSAFKNR